MVEQRFGFGKFESHRIGIAAAPRYSMRRPVSGWVQTRGCTAPVSSADRRRGDALAQIAAAVVVPSCLICRCSIRRFIRRQRLIDRITCCRTTFAAAGRHLEGIEHARHRRHVRDRHVGMPDRLAGAGLRSGSPFTAHWTRCRFPVCPRRTGGRSPAPVRGRDCRSGGHVDKVRVAERLATHQNDLEVGQARSRPANCNSSSFQVDAPLPRRARPPVGITWIGSLRTACAATFSLPRTIGRTPLDCFLDCFGRYPAYVVRKHPMSRAWSILL